MLRSEAPKRPKELLLATLKRAWVQTRHMR